MEYPLWELRSLVKQSLRSQLTNMKMLRMAGNEPDVFYSRSDIYMMIDRHRSTAKRYLLKAYNQFLNKSQTKADLGLEDNNHKLVFHAAALLWLCPSDLELLNQDYAFHHDYIDLNSQYFTAFHMLLIGYGSKCDCEYDRSNLDGYMCTELMLKDQQTQCFGWFMNVYREHSFEKDIAFMKASNGEYPLYLAILHHASAEIVEQLILICGELFYSRELVVGSNGLKGLNLWQVAGCLSCDLDILFILLKLDTTYMLDVLS